MFITLRILRCTHSCDHRNIRYFRRERSCTSERCITLNLPPLSFRRDCADLIFFFKCLHGLYAVQLEDFLDTNLHDKSLRSTSANCIFRPRFSKTTSFRQSYFNRVVPQLCQNIRSSESLDVFKSRLHCYFNNLSCDFDVNNKCSWSGTCKCYTCMCNRQLFARYTVSKHILLFILLLWLLLYFIEVLYTL